MAFDRNKLIRVDSSLSSDKAEFCGSCATWRYIITAAEDITGAGYIPTTAGVKGGDKVVKILLTVGASGNVTARADTEYYAATSTAGVITLTTFA